MPRVSLNPGERGDFQVRALEDGRIRVRQEYCRFDGVRKRTETRATSEAAGKRELNTRFPRLFQETSPENDAHDGTEDAAFSSVVAKWLQHSELLLAQEEISRGWFTEGKRIAHNILVPKFGITPVTEITPRVIAEAYTGWAQQWAPQARNAKVILNSIMQYAVAPLGIIDKNPAREVPVIRRKKRKEIFAPGISELIELRVAVATYMADPDRPGPALSPLLLDTIDLILLTGLRIGEVLGLRWDHDIFLQGDMPHIVVNGAVKEKGGPKIFEAMPKSESGLRVIALPEVAVEILRRRESGRNGKTCEQGFEYAFSTRSGRPNGPQDVHRQLRNVRSAAGLPANYVPHALRRTVGTEIADFYNLNAAAQFLGHAHARVTEKHYAKRSHETPDVRSLLTATHDLVTGRGVTDMPADALDQPAALDGIPVTSADTVLAALDGASVQEKMAAINALMASMFGQTATL